MLKIVKIKKSQHRLQKSMLRYGLLLNYFHKQFNKLCSCVYVVAQAGVGPARPFLDKGF